MSKKVMLSGVQTTNQFTLGNYLGAIRNWVKMQEEYECFFFLGDLHTITVRNDPKDLRDQVLTGMATYLACGLDPEKVTLFLQSQVKEHAELGWILNCHTHMGELNRMTQFKDKSAKLKNVGAGLFTYPTLMAGDILLYQADFVPTGQDQKQHIELTRDLAIRMNHTYREGLFKVPTPWIPPIGAKIMSLQNPLAKMSKSDADTSATVFLSDTDKQIEKKFKKAVTDSHSEIPSGDFDREGREWLLNLAGIQAAILEKSVESILESYAGKQYGYLKVDTAKIVVEEVAPIREKVADLRKNDDYLIEILRNGAQRASSIAGQTMAQVREAIGLLPA